MGGENFTLNLSILCCQTAPRILQNLQHKFLNIPPRTFGTGRLPWTRDGWSKQGRAFINGQLPGTKAVVLSCSSCRGPDEKTGLLRGEKVKTILEDLSKILSRYEACMAGATICYLSGSLGPLVPKSHQGPWSCLFKWRLCHSQGDQTTDQCTGHHGLKRNFPLKLPKLLNIYKVYWAVLTR